MTDWSKEPDSHPLRVHERERIWSYIDEMAALEKLEKLPSWLLAARYVRHPKDPLNKEAYDKAAKRGVEIWNKLQEEKNDTLGS